LDPGKNPTLKVVSLNTIADVTVATETMTATPSKSGVGFKLVYAPSIGYDKAVAVSTSQLVVATLADNNEGFLTPLIKNV